LSATAYPIWSVTLTLPASKSFQYKYIKKDATAKVLWESGDNRTATTSSSCSQILNDTWR
jgi:alpha-amylase